MQKAKTTSQIKKKRVQKKGRGTAGKIVRFFVWAVLIVFVLAAVTAACVYFYLNEDLPKISSLTDYHPPIITTVYSDDNRKIAEFYKERRIILPLEEIPETLKQAFIAAEDARFYKHKGIDITSIIRAFIAIEAGTIVQGGSTITQQVTKSFLLSPEKSYTRKIKEAILAYRIEKTFSKDEVLFLYLNQIYLGHGAYGVEAASENYFGKSARELNLAECAILAGLPQAPSRYSPFRHPEKAKQRQIYVLNRMVAEKYISNIQATEAIDRELDIKPRRNWFIEEVPFYTEHVRRYVDQTYGPNALYTQGLKIYTAVNIDMQKIAREEITKGLLDLDKRQGYRGPLQHLSPDQADKTNAYLDELQAEIDKQGPLEQGSIVKGVVTAVNEKKKTVLVRMGSDGGVISVKNMRWARKPDPRVAYYDVRINRPERVLRPGDVVLVKLRKKSKADKVWQLGLEQDPLAQAALLCLESESGHVKVLIGGRDFRESQFNRAVQSRRQPGSAFKPIIYSAAIDKGYTPATLMYDSPIVFEDTGNDFTWKPKNYKETFAGPTLVRKALVKSLNVITVKILQDIGVDYVIDYARLFGITSELSPNLSIALGSSGLSLLELTVAYSVFNNLGYRVQPIFITKILDRNGNILEENNTTREKVIDKSTAYIMTNLLEGVVKNGTGRRVRALKRPAAGKTGTTNDLIDAWFVGFTPRYVTGTWVGFDEEASLGKGETGSRSASPIWLEFMQRILKDKPIRAFQVPDDVVFAKIDAETGLLPVPESKKTLFECFKKGTVPTEYTPRPHHITEPDQFFKSNM